MLIYKNKIWAFIPARSGSRSIRDKNIKKINSVPLLIYSINTALNLKKRKVVDKIIFSSDSIKYINLVKKISNLVIIDRRLKKYSTASSTDLDVFRYFLKKNEKKYAYLPEFFLHLRPTTPIRKNKTIIKAVKYFIRNKQKFSALRSINCMENSSFKTMRIVNGKLCGISKLDFNMDKLNQPRQLYEKTYVANGYVDLVKTKNILKDIFHGSSVHPFLVNEFNSDIDNSYDLDRVRKYLNKNHLV